MRNKQSPPPHHALYCRLLRVANKLLITLTVLLLLLVRATVAALVIGPAGRPRLRSAPTRPLSLRTVATTPAYRTTELLLLVPAHLSGTATTTPVTARTAARPADVGVALVLLPILPSAATVAVGWPRTSTAVSPALALAWGRGLRGVVRALGGPELLWAPHVRGVGGPVIPTLLPLPVAVTLLLLPMRRAAAAAHHTRARRPPVHPSTTTVLRGQQHMSTLRAPELATLGVHGQVRRGRVRAHHHVDAARRAAGGPRYVATSSTGAGWATAVQ